MNNPELLAAIVFDGREGTPWMAGAKYIGRGPFQITHPNGYRSAMEEIRKQPGGGGCPDLVALPEALTTAELGIRTAFAE